ncbi:MarR family winged helix-turn-helix transcriptional regulator [Streptomyces sp. NPDC002758]
MSPDSSTSSPKADLVERRSDPHDQRACLLTLTPHGTALLDDIRREGLHLLTEQLGTLTAEQLAGLAAALPTLETPARAMAPASATRDCEDDHSSFAVFAGSLWRL